MCERCREQDKAGIKQVAQKVSRHFTAVVKSPSPAEAMQYLGGLSDEDLTLFHEDTHTTIHSVVIGLAETTDTTFRDKEAAFAVNLHSLWRAEATRRWFVANGYVGAARPDPGAVRDPIFTRFIATARHEAEAMHKSLTVPFDASGMVTSKMREMRDELPGIFDTAECDRAKREAPENCRAVSKDEARELMQNPVAAVRMRPGKGDDIPPELVELARKVAALASEIDGNVQISQSVLHPDGSVTEIGKDLLADNDPVIKADGKVDPVVLNRQLAAMFAEPKPRKRGEAPWQH